jgi:hypothetical protein
MTLYQYNYLDEAEQHEAIWEHGVHIGERLEGEYKIILYQIFSFYVELFYHMEFNVLRRLRSFSSTECLDAYIQQFDLKDIN